MHGNARLLEKTPTSAPRGARTLDAAPHARVSAPPTSSHTGAAPPAAPGAAANVRALQRLVGNQAVMRMLDARRSVTSPAAAVQTHHDEDEVQRKVTGLTEPSDEAIRSAAAEGVRTPSSSLPFLDRIQASFGRHSVGQVQAHVGPGAAEASRAMNAQAYASGDHVVFGGSPDLRTAAHEAAHVVQQRAGVQLAGGVGRVGDPYERHADAVAGAVVGGRSAEALLEPFSTGGAGIDTRPVQRMYSGSDNEQKSPIGENDDHEDLSAIKELIRNAFEVDDEDYQFVTDNGKYVGGTGNCHGYSLDGDLNEKLWLSDPYDFLEAYDQGGQEQKITVFTRGGEVAHSARGHGGECEHKVFVESGWGPLIKASAASAGGTYDQQFKFPEQRDDFERWIGTQGELQDQQEVQDDVMKTFYYFLKYNPNVLDKVQPKQLERYHELSNEDGSEQGVTEVLDAMEAITGERFDSPEAFLKKYKDSW